MKKGKSLKFVLTTVVVIMAAAVLLQEVISAGDLEPPGPPDSTMKTLDQIPPTWSQKLPASRRFELVLDGQAVLDKETGLVWQQSPLDGTQEWIYAQPVCYSLTVAGRRGWHLPTIEQLASLVDTSVSGVPKLPTGHPFNDVQASIYWSSTTAPGFADLAYGVSMENGLVNPHTKGNYYYLWCVRGGHGYDAY